MNNMLQDLRGNKATWKGIFKNNEGEVLSTYRFSVVKYVNGRVKKLSGTVDDPVLLIKTKEGNCDIKNLSDVNLETYSL